MYVAGVERDNLFEIRVKVSLERELKLIHYFLITFSCLEIFSFILT